MNEERRQTIVKEIDYWSRSKLLPQQYCDFLLNLYVDPDQEEDPKKGKLLHAESVRRSWPLRRHQETMAPYFWVFYLNFLGCALF